MYETITHSRSARIWGHIALMRPYAWLWFDLLPASVLILLLHPTSPSPYRLLAFLIGIVLADSGVSTLNDLCDVETDRSSTEADRNTRPIVAGLVSPRAAVVQVVLLLTAAPLMMSFASIRAALVFLTAIALGVAYSVPPFRLSGRPWTSQFVWPTLGLLCYATVALFTGHWFTTAAFVYLAGVGFFYAIGETLAKDIRDWDNDRAAGKRTSVVVLGTARAAVYSLLASTLGSLFLVTLFWWRGEMHLVSRIAGTVLLLLWLLRAGTWIVRLRSAYEKSIATRLHVGYIRVYLVLNLILLADKLVWLSHG